MKRRAEEDKQAAREQRRLLREQRVAEKKAPKPAEPEPTEAELVTKYALRVVRNQIYHGRGHVAHSHTINKKLWLDYDFFFSVVFQSSTQKYAFMEALRAKFPGIEFDEKEQIQILNGLLFAKLLGIPLEMETARDFPAGNLELMPFVMDNEEVEVNS